MQQPPPPQRYIGPPRYPTAGGTFTGTPRAPYSGGLPPSGAGPIGGGGPLMGGVRMGPPASAGLAPHVGGSGGMAQTPGSSLPHSYQAPAIALPPTSSRGAVKGKEKEKGGLSGNKGVSAATAEKEKEEECGGVHPGGSMPSPMHPGLDRKRPAPTPDPRLAAAQQIKAKKKKKVADKILPQRVRDLVPESQAYMDLLSFERKLDSTIMRKRLDIQEALKRPMKQKKKLRIFISNTFYPAKHEADDGEESVASWELRVEGRLMEDGGAKGASGGAPPGVDPNKAKRKFSSFFKSLVIELDKDLYGPDNHLVEWHRTATTQETDGFQVKRPGDQNVKCTLLLMLDYQPMQFKLDLRLARLLGIHTQTRPVIINALWQYIKTHRLQDSHEREYINCDKYLEQILECSRMKFSEIPTRLHPLLMPPDPIVINHVIMVDGPDAKKTACYDIDVEVDDTLKQQMHSFLLSTQSQQEIQALDNKIHETVETINQLKTNRDFFLGFAKAPQEFINNWLVSQTRDLKTMTDVAGNPEEERHSEFYYQPWSTEAVNRYFFGKVQQRRLELEQVLGVRNQ